MSADALHENWTIYMNHLLARLNDLLAQGAEQAMQSQDLKQVLVQCARNPSRANLFNYASMAHNHHFFMSTISTRPNVPMSQKFEDRLAKNFSSVHTLRESFLDVANAMFGPGHVWLVLQYRPAASSAHRTMAAGVDTYSQNGSQPSFDFRILSTYIAGSPYPGAHARQQAHNLTETNLAAVRDLQTRQADGVPRSYRADQSSQLTHGVPGGNLESISRWSGADVMPLMCVSTWQHAYMQDWGVDGKKLFLQAWWDRIDWMKVEEHAGIEERRRRELETRPRYR
ncbi:MAG: hypothetical protein Q9162_006848 [Coniocarpon cinnabarinum]